MNLEYISAKRTSINTVEVTYKLDGVLFTVEWDNVHPETGEVGEYDLYSGKCADGVLLERIQNAILEGESDDNPDVELYLFIRDEFDRGDAERLGAYTLTATDWSIESHGQTVTIQDKFGNNYEVFLQLPRTPDSQITIDGDKVAFDDEFQNAIYEMAKNHLYELFEDDDVARASFKLGAMVDSLTETTVGEIEAHNLLDCTDTQKIKRLITNCEMMTARVGDKVHFLMVGQYADYYNVRYFDEVDFSQINLD